LAKVLNSCKWIRTLMLICENMCVLVNVLPHKIYKTNTTCIMNNDYVPINVYGRACSSDDVVHFTWHCHLIFLFVTNLFCHHKPNSRNKLYRFCLEIIVVMTTLHPTLHTLQSSHLYKATISTHICFVSTVKIICTIRILEHALHATKTTWRVVTST